MQVLEFAEILERRGITRASQWLVAYSLHAKRDHSSYSQVAPKSANYMMTKSLFDSRQFEAVAANVDLDTCSDKDQACLALVAENFIIQKRERKFQLPSSGTSATKGKLTSCGSSVEYSRLVSSAERVYSKFSNDSVVNYIYASVLLQRGDKSDTDFIVELLVRAIKQAPYNWAAWRELTCIERKLEDQDEKFLKQQELFSYYKIERLRYLKKFKAVLSEIADLGISDWSYLDEIEGSCLHDMRDFASSARAFERIRKRDPFHLSGMDEYSNCLFVLERESDLSQLASHWLEVNPNAMETNVIVGNLFSLKGDHEKSALYFKRATIVDPQSINAWLLLGHELIELRNPSAAFAAYQHATICPGAARDMRPWYAMGQLFELINQMAFAVFYHNKAIQVNPKDPRVWKALSGCYLKLNRIDESNHCNLKVKGLSSDPSAMAM